jgi:hypothetical protein
MTDRIILMRRHEAESLEQGGTRQRYPARFQKLLVSHLISSPTRDKGGYRG